MKNFIKLAFFAAFCFLITPSESNAQPKILGHAQVTISEKIIRSVGEQDPRMAVALINVQKINVGFSTAKLYFSAIQYTAYDVENHLTQTHKSAYFTDFNKRAGDIMLAGAAPVVYEVSIGEDASSGATILVVKTADPSALRSAIHLTLSKITSGKGKDISEGFKADSWEFN